MADPASATALIAAQQAACAGWLADLSARAEALSGERGYDWLVLQFRIGQIEAIAAWLETCADTLLAAQP